MAASHSGLAVVADVLLRCLVGSRVFAADRCCLSAESAVMSFFEAQCMCLSGAAIAGIRAAV
jgi:hypothetical protein